MKRSTFHDYDEVQNLHIQDLLDTYKPDIIKIDVEGAEYQILEYIEAYYPEVIFVELHMGKVKEHAQPAIERLTALYPINEVKSFIVFKEIGGYDCWFKK
jgi:hypothetical protein